MNVAGRRSDSKLIGQLKTGDALAFEEIYRLFKNKLFSYFFSKTKSRQDAEDLVQNTFYRVWRYRKSFSTGFLIEQQLFHISRTVFIDHLRKQSKLTRTLQAAAVPSPIETEPNIVLEKSDMLKKALAELPKRRREFFQLQRLQGYSYKEVADIFSVTVKSVDNSIMAAVRQLKSLNRPTWIIIILIGLSVRQITFST